MSDKEKLKEEINVVKNNSNTAEDTAQAFDDFYDLLASKRVNLKVLDCLFTNFVSLWYQHTKTYKFLNNKAYEIDAKLKPTLDNTQKELFEQYETVQNEFLNDYGLQAFVTGVLLADEIKDEMKQFSNDNNELKDLINSIKINKDPSKTS